MDTSVSFRLLLLGLLPVIAMLLFIEGQRYDPALIQFPSSPSIKESIIDFFPESIAEFQRRGRIRTFNRENLYEYVNGHAEYFISAGFSRLSVAEYVSENSLEDSPDLVIDIYDMGTSIQAFGVVSDESGGRLSEFDSGVTGFRTPLGSSFIRGQYYVKILSYNEKIPLDPIISDLNSNISEGADPFPEFSGLPDIGDVISTRFIREDYRGLDFVHNVVEREYAVEGGTVQIFVISDNKAGIDNLLSLFVTYFNDSEVSFSEEEREGITLFRIKDPYEGDWVLVPLRDKLFGIFGTFDDAVITSILAERG